ncbi:tyrosine protein kinase receptor torso [Haematobia irritans]|uniref:tyrosine protein kinase receptor torso n=1 Tax=Haematobia irritans TaxID=7368 RepID=UPI003F4F94AE
MLLLYYTKTIVFLFGLTSLNFSKDLVEQLHKYDYQYLPQEVCIARCLGRSSTPTCTTKTPMSVINDGQATNKTRLEFCVDYCSKPNAFQECNQTGGATTVKRVHENYSLTLICRDESSLNFRINLHISPSYHKYNRTYPTDMTTTPRSSLVSVATTSNKTPSTNETISDYASDDDEKDTVLFVIKVHLSNETEKFMVYLSDDSFFTITELSPNSTYNISAMAVHSSNKYSVIALEEQFQTLRRSYIPGNITDIKVSDFLEDKENKMHLSAVLTWKPPPDMTCHYDIICFSPESEEYDLQPLEIRNPRQLYKYQLENLTFSSVYKVGIRARNSKNMKESDLFWKTFRAPSCVEWHNYNFSICAPEAPQNLKVDQIILERNLYALNVSWDAPTYLPDNYTLFTTDLSPSGKRKYFNISKDIHNFYIDRIVIYGVWFEVGLIATSMGGSTTTRVTEVTKTVVDIPEKNPFVKVIAAILAPIFCVVILSMTIFMIYHRRAKLKRYQERCKYFEELEKKAPTDPKENFVFMHSLSVSEKKLSQAGDTFSYPMEYDQRDNDDMEINRNQLTLYEVLGEGAFGLVKRGIYQDNKLGKSYEVAVKMLKDNPNGDEIRSFRREIEVMKSVEKHPNIVGIIGHCTRSSDTMMLLTEYCSLGNLLDFLRDEWRFLHEIQRRRNSISSKIFEVELPRIVGKSAQDDFECKILLMEDELPLSPPPPPPPPPPTIGSDGADTPVRTINEDNNEKHLSKTMETFKNIVNNSNNSNDHKALLKELIFEGNTISQSAIEKFKRKYNELNQSVLHENKINDNGVSSNPLNQSIENIGSNIGDNIPVANTTIPTSLSLPSSIKKPMDMSHKPKVVSFSPLPLESPATENKSYGYQGCCTNSCKCNVDVITNINALDANKEQEELTRLLSKRQEPLIVGEPSQNHTIISIKNCDCSHHRQSRQSVHHISPMDREISTDEKIQHKSVVENAAYFKIFNSKTDENSARTKSPLSFSSLPVPSSSPASSSSVSISTFNENALLMPRVPLTAGDLLDIARQVAIGMDFLAKNKVVHRDLAARNVLVAPDRTVKIADFGLSRDIYQENIYKKTGNGKLPIKWLALESLTHQVYTTQSDVWSYGILLYEIITLGATPYPSIPTNRLLHLLKTGYRMEKPKNCGPEFYDLMSSCWYSTPSERPTFNEIIKKLNEMQLQLQTSAQSSMHSPQETQNSNDQKDNNCGRDEIENDLCKQEESPMQQICCDDSSYLKPL